MFITLKYPTHQEHILTSSIIKFAVFPKMVEITLSEISVKNDSIMNCGFITNRSLEITQEVQPMTWSQIQEYLKS